MSETRIPSGSKIPGVSGPVNVLEVGNPGQPTEVIVHNGKIYVYNASGQTLIDGGIVQTKALVTGMKSWVHDISFTATDKDTASWSAGTIYFGDGSTQNVNSGNTGNIASKTYLYYDETSTLQKTTNLSFISDDYFLVAVVEPSTENDEKAIVTVRNMAQGTISADNVIAGNLNADRIAAGSLTISKLTSSVQNEIEVQIPSDYNLVGYWSFDSRDGSDVPDLSGNSNDGSLTNMASGNYDFGISQYMLDFNGSDEHMSVPDTSDINTMEVIYRSYSFWVKADGTSNRQVIYKEGDSSNSIAIYIESNTIYFVYADSGSLIGYCSATLNDTNWHNIVCTFDSSSGEQILYIDGEQKNTDNKSTSVGSHSGNISFAYNDGDFIDHSDSTESDNHYLDGKLDEFRIYNQTLTSREVLALYKIPSGNNNKTLRFEDWSHASDVTKIDGGNIYAGSSIVLGSSGYIRSGMTDYDTGDGWWIGDDGGTAKLSIGSSSGVRMLWNGSDLVIKDKNNNLVIDEEGIVGTTAFTQGNITLSSAFTADGSWRDVGNLSHTISIGRNNTPVLIFGKLLCQYGFGDANYRIKIGSNYYPESFGWEVRGPSGMSSPTDAVLASPSFAFISELDTGDITIKVQAVNAGANPVLIIDDGRSNLGYVVLGK